MSLGPCGDAIGLSTMTVYALSIAQLPAMFALVIKYPAVKGDFFATTTRVIPNPQTNGTAVDLHNPTQLHYMHSINLSAFFLITSALCCFFCIITVYIMDKGVGELSKDVGYENYISSNVDLITHPTISMWNNVFVSLVLAEHGLLAAVLNSPSSIHFLLLILLLTYISMGMIILQPRYAPYLNSLHFFKNIYLGL